MRNVADHENHVRWGYLLSHNCSLHGGMSEVCENGQVHTEESMVLLSGRFPEKRICKACSMVFIGCSMAFLTTWPTGENMSVINSIILTVMQLFILK